MEETNGAGRMKCESRIESRCAAAICRRSSLPKPVWQRPRPCKISFNGAPQKAWITYHLMRLAGMISKHCGGSASLISAASYTSSFMPTPWNVDELEFVGYANVLNDDMLPSVVPPVFRLRSDTKRVLLPPYSDERRVGKECRSR